MPHRQFFRNHFEGHPVQFPLKLTHCLELMVFLLAPALMAASPEAAPAAAVARAANISFSEDDFRNGTAHKTNSIALAPGYKLTVDLGSNPTTGFSWGENDTNSQPLVVKQVKHERTGAKNPMPGAGGSQIWTFEALKTGTAILDFSYGRPWEGGEKGEWTLNVTVTVR